MKCSKHRCGAVCVCRGQMQRRKGPLPHFQAQNKIGTSERDGFLARGTRHGPRDTGRPISICLINDTLYGIHAICGDLLVPPSVCPRRSCRPHYSIRWTDKRSVGRRLRLLVTRNATPHHCPPPRDQAQAYAQQRRGVGLASLSHPQSGSKPQQRDRMAVEAGNDPRQFFSGVCSCLGESSDAFGP